jgi:hypothetical protein
MTPLSKVEVPNRFAALGFSGLFHTRCSFPNEEARAKFNPPCLVHSDSWLLLRIDDEGMGVLVRRDSNAVVEALTKRTNA